MMADIFFAHQDPLGELQKFRHQVPPFVLRTFCDNTAVTAPTSGQQMWIYDQNQMYIHSFFPFEFFPRFFLIPSSYFLFPSVFIALSIRTAMILSLFLFLLRSPY